MNSRGEAGRLRRSGIDVIGEVPWGTHFCQFYQTHQDLLELLIPYFRAGLESNELCMWVTSEPLGVEDATKALRKAVPDLDRMIRRGQIEIIPHTEWYLLGGTFDKDRILNGWVRKLNEALARGYAGLRLSGDTLWLEREDWQSFTDYEEVINSVLGNYRMLALCTCSTNKCGAGEVADVIANHEFALMKRGGEWVMMESSTVRQAKQALQIANEELAAGAEELERMNEELRVVEDELRAQIEEQSRTEMALRESEERYRGLFDSMSEGFALHKIICNKHGVPVNYLFVEVNEAFERLTGLRREDVIGKTVLEALPGTEPSWIDTYGRVALTGEPARFESHSTPLGKWYDVYAFSPRRGQFAVLFSDVTGRKRRERELDRLNRTLAAHNRSSHAMMRATTEQEYLDEVCRIVIEDCGHAMVWIGYAENDASRSVRPVAYSGFEEGYLETLGITWADNERGRGPTGTAIRTGKPSMCRNMLTDPRFEPWREQAIKRGYASSIVLPLVSEKEAFGAITIYSRDPDPFTDDEVALLSDLADDLAYGITTIRTREERDRAEAALRESERLYRAIGETINYGVWVCAPDGRNTYASESFLKLVGITQEQCSDFGWGEVLHPDDAESTIAAWKECARTGGTWDIEHRFRGVDGQWHPVLARGVPVRDEQGAITCWAGINLDISRLKQAEVSLADARAEAEQRAAELESFFASMEDGVMLLDSQGRIVLSNKTAAAVLGVDPSSSLTDRVKKAGGRRLDGTPMPVEETAADRALRGEVVSDARCVVPSEEQANRVLSFNSSPVRAADGNVVGAVVVFRDITEQVEFERQKDELFEREHRIAQMLQQALIPPQVPAEVGGFRIGVRYQPALREAEVGGDFYDVFELGNDRLAVLIGDVAGKGLAAAMRVAAARHAIRSYAFIDPRPAHVLTLANEALCKDNTDPHSMLTAFFAVIDTATGKMAYTSAGHEPPLLCHASGVIDELWFAGMPLGVEASSTYSEAAATLVPGDTLVIVTDGITEARATGPVLFEKKGMIEFLSTDAADSPSSTASGLLDAATKHAGGHLQDDAAVVVVRLECGTPTT